MTIANGSDILAEEINEAFDVLKADLNEWKDQSNSFSVFRFRLQGDAGAGAKKTFVFRSPDDFDIYTIGLAVSTGVAQALGTAIVTAQIQGAVTDQENDLPVPTHLHLMESISNTDDGEKWIKLEFTAGSTSEGSTRYVTYDLDNDRPCNTLLKGSMYEIIVRSSGTSFTGDYTIEVIFMVKPVLRRF